jgi:DNA-binding transcriptional LysR family regulator
MGTPVSLADPLSGRELAAFVAAVETGSVQGAADELVLTQSAATKRIQALEARVGQPLLERTAHGVKPTPVGGVLYPAARQALSALLSAEAAVLAPGLGSYLRIQSSRTIGETLLPHWLSAFRAECQPRRAQISVEITNSEQVLRAVRSGEAEIGFVEGPAGGSRGVREVVVAVDEIRAVVAAGHPWARRRGVKVSELASESFLARETGSGTRAVTTETLARAGVNLHPVLEVSSAEGLKRAVLDGGFALLSERVVVNEVQSGQLVALPVADVDLSRSLRAISLQRPALKGPAREFWKWLMRAVAEPAGPISGAPDAKP